ncbi:hypothetical protein [Serpentinicella alkaliphila]|uniref:Uncharacterized protein n=1 Tax=Serpentinicella alkaliphila TaxID=1734049 RepID=A0A4R2TY60_9FIRM|nr:hypothetical protein [Serpentinicella alkaliphila]QUH26782.1 hypothetical protein HZR23_14320 [Serpentinicella alkaliphila]TCQ08002.1 hypothetical protein EDD79_100186 [Serpentinicella alkaliphila]
MTFKKIMITFCLVLLFVVFTTGCRPQERPVPQERTVPQDQQQQWQTPLPQEPQQTVPQRQLQPTQPQPQNTPVPGAGG